MSFASVGHWAKIASELPHRTGSQCLSKWKIMVRVSEVSPVGQPHHVSLTAGGMRGWPARLLSLV